SDEVLQVEEGTLYPALHRMERKGWLASEWRKNETGRRARFYSLSDGGKAHLVKARGDWARTTSAVGRVIGVASRGTIDCENSIYAYVAPYETFLKDVVRYASGLGDYPPPAWTAGSDVIPEVGARIGGECSSDAECGAGRCIDDGTSQYCSRRCDPVDAPCPESDYQCLAVAGETANVCVVNRTGAGSSSFAPRELGRCSLGTWSAGPVRRPGAAFGLAAALFGFVTRRLFGGEGKRQLFS
ncbi:MAG: helix-turn-helix transcriptional regulator, partial [Myxococcota bacterium]